MTDDLMPDSCSFAMQPDPPHMPVMATRRRPAKPRLRWWPAPLLALGLLAGCTLKEDTLGLDVVGYNHTTNRSIYDFWVDGYPGGNLDPDSGGGSFMCCVPVPVKWHQGQKVRIRWKYQNWYDVPAPQPPWREAEVEVPRYSDHDLSRFAVHFFPDDKVKVLVTRLAEKNAGYPADLKWNAPTPADAAVGRPLDLSARKADTAPSPSF